MHAIADTQALVADGVITADQAHEIEARARSTMITAAINTILSAGILAATGGLILFLASPLAVAICGFLALSGGLAVLVWAAPVYRMFGNAAALIGAGMLLGGAAWELTENYENIAGWTMLVGGGAVTGIAALSLLRGGYTARFVAGSILLMGLAMHLAGLGIEVFEGGFFGVRKVLYLLYAAVAIAAAGWVTDTRIVTALAVVPFAQTLETGTGYWSATYVFWSPEPTLTIFQMGLLIGACLWVVARSAERTARHAGILALLAFVTANLSALVGSLFGDVVGQTVWGPDYAAFEDYEVYQAARDAFAAQTLVISEHLYSILWAAALIALAVWAAHGNRRGLFNAAMTFGAIHAYTQLFESFSDEPLAYVFGGLAAVPLAWGMWRLNHWLQNRGM